MSEQLTQCKKCGSVRLTTLKVINPDSIDMNMKAELKCDECGEVAIYEVASNHYRKLRNRGSVI